MKDKSSELLTQLYSEMKKDFDDVQKELDKKADKSDIARLEYEFKEHINALYDGYELNYESIQELKAAK